MYTVSQSTFALSSLMTLGIVEQTRVEQSRTEKNRKEQNRAVQSRTEQNRKEQKRTEEKRAIPVRDIQCRSERYSHLNICLSPLLYITDIRISTYLCERSPLDLLYHTLLICYLHLYVFNVCTYNLPIHVRWLL